MSTKTFTIHEALYSNRSPKTLIAVNGDTQYHLYDLQLHVKSLAVYMQVTKYKSFAICVEDTYLFLMGLLACFYAHKTPVLVGQYRSDLGKRDHGLFDAILTDSDELKGCELPSFNVKEILNACPPRPLNEIPEVNKDATLTPVLSETTKVVFYTSGSTGKAKRIEKTVLNLEKDIRHLANLTSSIENIENVVFTATVAPYHLYGITFRVFLPFLRGYVFDTRLIRYSEELCENFKDKNSVLISSPAFLGHIDTNLKSPKIFFTLSAGSPLSKEVAQKYYNWSNCAVTEIYGSTETSFMAHRANPLEELFTPFDEVFFKEMSSFLYVFSPLIDKKHKLDDKIEFVGDKFKVLGREDRVVKIADNRVSLTLIEKVIKENDLVSDCMALPIEMGTRTVVGVVIEAKKDLYDNLQSMRHDFVKELKLKLKDHVIAVAIPRKFRFVEKMPVNSMGKKLVGTLKELFNQKG